MFNIEETLSFVLDKLCLIHVHFYFIYIVQEAITVVSRLLYSTVRALWQKLM